MNMDFEVMFKNERVASVSIKDNKTVAVRTHTKTAYKQPFLKEPVTHAYVHSFLKKRAVPAEKGNMDEVIKQLKLKEYNVIDILRKTHGTNFDDFIWIKFNDEENITWENVKLR